MTNSSPSISTFPPHLASTPDPRVSKGSCQVGSLVLDLVFMEWLFILSSFRSEKEIAETSPNDG